mmetsp:Transcript_74437/g.141750  ORF Transcript_74437/g.141750 Transcript_74437/m.141750 type:complete len:81 (-) Transcript_74437:116-358(-)
MDHQMARMATMSRLDKAFQLMERNFSVMTTTTPEHTSSEASRQRASGEEGRIRRVAPASHPKPGTPNQQASELEVQIEDC